MLLKAARSSAPVETITPPGESGGGEGGAGGAGGDGGDGVWIRSTAASATGVPEMATPRAVASCDVCVWRRESRVSSAAGAMAREAEEDTASEGGFEEEEETAAEVGSGRPTGMSSHNHSPSGSQIEDEEEEEEKQSNSPPLIIS